MADYFVQSVNDHDYTPSHDVIRHVDEILKMMRILTRDPRFEMPINKPKPKKEVVTMCEVLDKIEARGIEKGREEGRKEERAAYAARESNYLSRIAELEARLAMKEGARSI